MRISAIRHYIPERVIGLDETLDLFKHYSKPFHDEKSMDGMLQEIEGWLGKTGFNEITVRGPKEKWLEGYLDMTREMIEEAGVPLDEIDKVIYISVGRGYREPAMAHILAANLGIRHAECFDILDACASWARAAHLMEPHFITGRVQNVLVLSLEFNRSPLLGNAVDPTGGENTYKVKSPSDELHWGVWTCTVGEAGTSTLLGADESADPWAFEFYSDSDFHKYCGYTLVNHKDYDLVPNLLEETIGGTERFYAFAREIGRSINDYFMVALTKPEIKPLVDEAVVVIPHTVSIPPYQKLFKTLGIDEKAVYSFAEHGNTVSCGVPLGLSKSIASGKVKRGDRVLLTPSGSGASYGVVSFRY